MLEKKLVKYRDAGQNLYVVTEAVELINGTVLQDKSSITALGKFLLPWTTYVQVRAVPKVGGGTRGTAPPPCPGALDPIRACLQGSG